MRELPLRSDTLPAGADSSTFEVAVIGAGPAGSSAARLLASWGHSVAVLGRPPRHPALAESLPPSCTKLFDQLGLRKTVDGAGFVRATGNTVQWADQKRRVELFDVGPRGYQVGRDVFDALLGDAARASGATMFGDATVRGLERIGQAWRVAYDTRAGQSAVTAQWVLDCSGRAGVVARRGMRKAEVASRTTAVVGIWDSHVPWPMEDATHTLVESYDGGWAWSVPVSPHRRYVTVMLDPSVTSLPSRAGLAAAYREELSRTSALDSLVALATFVDSPWACDASPYSADRVHDDHVLLVGDAASFVDPLSSFGVKKALASAWLASAVVHTALTDATLTSPALELFSRREQAMYVHLQRQFGNLARDAAGAHESGFWRNRGDAVTDDSSENTEMLTALSEARLRAAFDDLKARPSIQLNTGAGFSLVERATVQGHRIAMQTQIATPHIPNGMRYYRNVDLVLLHRAATQHDQVPAIFDAYNRAAPPAPLPDFLAALSVLLSLEVLSFA